MSNLDNGFKVYSDFPNKGVSFLDISPVLSSNTNRSKLKKRLSFDLDRNFKGINSDSIDKVVCIESRGFIFGEFISSELEAGLILARKPGKLPGEVVSQAYGTEYSSDCLSIKVGLIKEGDSVLIHDDVLATGGTALAVKKLVESQGATVVGYIFLAEIGNLNGRELLDGIVSCVLTF